MFDFADVLLEVLRLKASDLHLTAGSPPMVRQKGRLGALDYPALSPQQTREIIYSILTNDQRKKLEKASATSRRGSRVMTRSCSRRVRRGTTR